MISNFRLVLSSLFLLNAIAVSSTAIAQTLINHSASMEDRITVLERITNAQSQLFSQLQQQLSDNQLDIDLLRGQIQENRYNLNQINLRQKQDLLQLNSRNNVNQTTRSKNDLSLNSANNHCYLANPTVLPNNYKDYAKTEYNSAINLVILKKQNDQAIIAFQQFIKKYPNSIYQPNANYWLGQLLYKKNKKDDAVYYFAVVVKNYPQSSKSSEAMYKVGVIMQEKGDLDKACIVYKNVIKEYPGSDAAKKAQKIITTL
ncbi:tol-pal system protein YbgF [Candidatus Profftia sp. (ex Adelges kitamiensis)]|uniref:tol-pal system protein YbgF n=1 Tax=Candidatus Profftia sp. (ex Adelges kitamiensis) TaxID=2864218 RepID=UPI001CE24CFD|nr:tol-pal system protein YbgF [Candidatus Profftia sp. (ex Adelges kitamiensis)]